MKVFWCEKCETPVLYSKNKDEEKAEENPYLDIEDEVIEWGLSNKKGEAYYDEFLKLKSKVSNMLDNKKSLEEIELKIEEIELDLNLKAANKLKDFGKRYVNVKLMSNETNKPRNIKCPNCEEEVFYIGKDIRPVFMKERILLSVLLEKDLTKDNIWRGSGSRYLIDGKPTKIVNSDLYTINNLEQKKEIVRKRIKECDQKVDFSNFIDANKEHFKYIDKQAIDFIENGSEFFSKRKRVVSFSGGKDSTVVSDLVRRALNNWRILHIFGDTTLEFPHTYEYIKRLKDEPKPPPFLPIDKPNKSFYQLAEKFGPPSRVISWCCNIFKTGPIGNLFRQIAKEEKILTYYGIRRSESKSRSNYDKVTQSPKIAKQLVLSPIIDWHDAEVWLYILTRGINFNEAYELGFKRVGCMCCPNNSKWSEFLSEIFMPNRAESWRSFLVEFAKKVGKPDPEVYVDTGKWKARQGGQGLDISDSLLESDPCGLGDQSKEFELSKPIDERLYEFFKPFGIIDKEIGNKMLGEVYILDHKSGIPRIKLQGNSGSKMLKVVVPEEEEKVKIKKIKQVTGDSEGKENKRLLFQRIECQLRKFQICEKCSACSNICPEDAISLIGGYTIDEENCVHCMECVAHFHKGCLITKATVDY